MFTGIIECVGKVKSIETHGSNLSLWVESWLSHELKVDQSVAHNGICLTIEEIRDGEHRVTAVAETLEKTNLDDIKVNDPINLERCVPLNGRLDGHLVQGHIDTTALCIGKTDRNGSWIYNFEYPSEFAGLIIEKGSITINGVSLTIFNITEETFEVTIIPYTYGHTNLAAVEMGKTVNIEFDILGKYVNRIMALKNNSYLSNL